jgi:predicted dehydrogenase
MLKICVIGLGSIGKRHIVNLHAVLEDRKIIHVFDLIRTTRSNPVELSILPLVNHIYTLEDEIPSDYDIAFVTNPTHLHFDTIRRFVLKAKHFFIEKPLFHTDNLSLDALGLIAGNTYYVACPLRYHGVLREVARLLPKLDVHGVRAISSSYLPEWRPGQDYTKSYSANADMGGGVSIDLIHEWDYLIHFFGFPASVYNFRGKFSNLQIDSDDCSIYIAAYPTMVAEVHLDYFGRAPIRELQLFDAEETIVADIVHQKIRFLKSGKSIAVNEDGNAMYLREMHHFLDIIEGKAINDNPPAHALAVLRFALKGKIEP